MLGGEGTARAVRGCGPQYRSPDRDYPDHAAAGELHSKSPEAVKFTASCIARQRPWHCWGRLSRGLPCPAYPGDATHSMHVVLNKYSCCTQGGAANSACRPGAMEHTSASESAASLPGCWDDACTPKRFYSAGNLSLGNTRGPALEIPNVLLCQG
jgi:hypothetical protein